MIEIIQRLGEEEQEVLLNLSLKSRQGKKRSRQMTIYFAVMALLFCFLSRLDGDITWGIAGVVLLVIGLVLPRTMMKILMKRAYRNMDPRMTSGERRYQIDAAGVTVISEVTSGTTAWSGFSEWGEYGNYLWIMRMDHNVVLINRNNLTPEQLNTLLEYVKKIPGNS